SIPLLAAMSLGTEYQQRTLPLLLAQPCKRSRLWNEKLLVLFLTVASVALICPAIMATLGLLVAGRIPHPAEPEFIQICVAVAIAILATVCSTGFWTMVARSTIGGLVFSAASQFMVLVVIGVALQKIYGEVPVRDSIVTGTVVVTGLIYSAIFLWL